jgi:hypothetical protein
MPKGQNLKRLKKNAEEEEVFVVPVVEPKPSGKQLKAFLTDHIGDSTSLREYATLLRKSESSKRLVNSLINHIFVEINSKPTTPELLDWSRDAIQVV